MTLYAPRQVTARIATRHQRMFKGGNLAGVAPRPYDEFALVMGQFSVSSVGFALAPAMGSLSPGAWRGATLDRILCTDAGLFTIETVGDGRFPEVEGFGVLAVLEDVAGRRVAIPTEWDIDRYSGAVPLELYSELVALIGQPLRLALGASE